MPEIAATVVVNIQPLAKFKQRVDDQLQGTSNGPVRRALKRWAVRVRSYLQERFDTFSKGGGDWAKLSAATIAARRRPNPKNRKAKNKKKVRVVSILRDKGLLYAVLSPSFTGKPGSIEQSIKGGFRIGYGGPATHPPGKITLWKIAAYHQKGGVHLPQRKIIVKPSTAVIIAMKGDLKEALKSEL